MAEGGDWGGDAVTSTSRKQKGGKLSKVGKFFKRLQPGTSSKKDGENTGTTTEKQSGIKSRMSMECKAAEEEREQCQSRGQGIGDVGHGPGTDPSGEIHHDRDSSNKESSSLIQGAELQNLGTSVDTMAEGGDRGGDSVACTSKEQKDINSAISTFLSNCDDHQLLQLTRFYWDRLEQAIEEVVDGLGLKLTGADHFTGQEYHSVTELAEKGNQAAGSKLLLNLVMEKGSGARRVMWQFLAEIRQTLLKLSRLLKEILAQGQDQFTYMDTVQGLSEVPTHLKGK
ncbi:uncharacterized protein LOC116973723 [Amblyraja radiata]|uniref:uncharacterized protein LOC116973723 n=1 Tax=Amblyraja radiata TaxID=386614 RepID=UPI00140242FC|nr:uncharacterized protein LOC116973723 [Amblyraja radiata]